MQRGAQGQHSPRGTGPPGISIQRQRSGRQPGATNRRHATHKRRKNERCWKHNWHVRARGIIAKQINNHDPCAKITVMHMPEDNVTATLRAITKHCTCAYVRDACTLIRHPCINHITLYKMSPSKQARGSVLGSRHARAAVKRRMQQCQAS